MDCSLPGSSVHGIFQARVLGCVAIAEPKSDMLPTHLSLKIIPNHLTYCKRKTKSKGTEGISSWTIKAKHILAIHCKTQIWKKDNVLIPDLPPEKYSQKFKFLTLQSGDTNKLICVIIHMHVGALYISQTYQVHSNTHLCAHAQLFFFFFFLNFFLSLYNKNGIVQFSSGIQSCLTLRPHELQHARPPCPSLTPGVHSNPCPLSRWCHQPSTLSCPSPPALNLSQHQGLFKWLSSSQVAKVLEFQLQHQSFQWTPRTDLL